MDDAGRAKQGKCKRCRGSGFEPTFDGDGPMECRLCGAKVPDLMAALKESLRPNTEKNSNG